MYKYIKHFILNIIFFLLVGCATLYGPYGMTGGYKEQKFDDNTYIVSFHGNGNTPAQQVWNFWIYRCAELTIEKGYEFFTLQPATGHVSSNNPNQPGPVTFTMLPHNDQPISNDALIKPVYYTSNTFTIYSSDGVIDMYKRPVPKNAGLLLDANTIIEQLKPYVKSNTEKKPPIKKALLIRAAVEAAIRANRIKADDADKLRNRLKQAL